MSSTEDCKNPELDHLIRLLEHERAHPSSCTPDIVDRMLAAYDEHLEANEEPPRPEPCRPCLRYMCSCPGFVPDDYYPSYCAQCMHGTGEHK